jgi:hypothetical protein
VLKGGECFDNTIPQELISYKNIFVNPNNNLTIKACFNFIVHLP